MSNQEKNKFISADICRHPYDEEWRGVVIVENKHRQQKIIEIVSPDEGNGWFVLAMIAEGIDDEQASFILSSDGYVYIAPPDEYFERVEDKKRDVAHWNGDKGEVF